MKREKPRPGERTNLIKAREHLGLTRPQLAEMIGIDRTVIFKVETGVQDTTVAHMRRWIAVLGPGNTLDLFKPPPRTAQQQHEPAA